MKCRVPFLAFVALAMLVLAVVPAVLIWVIVFLAMTQSNAILTDASQSSLQSLSASLQRLLITSALQSFSSHVQGAAQFAAAATTLLRVRGVDRRDLRAQASPVPGVLADMNGALFGAALADPFISYIGMRAIQTTPATWPAGTRSFWLGHQAMNLDALSGAYERTLYGSVWELAPDLSYQTNFVLYEDQVTAEVLQVLAAYNTTPGALVVQPQTAWTTDIDFNAYSLLPEVLYYQEALPAPYGVWTNVQLALNVYTISDELRAALPPNSTSDRLFVLFRQPHGHLIGASHGKFFSHSDEDLRQHSALKDPLNVSQFQAYTCLQSTDPFIAAACEQLYIMANKSWMAIPDGQWELDLNGTAFWVAAGWSSAAGLNCTVVALKPRLSVMGPIEIQASEAQRQIAEKKVLTYAVLGAATAIAVVCPVLIGCLLQRRLKRLGSGLTDKGAPLYSVTAL